MLKLIIGESGSGKSVKMREQIKQNAAENKRVLVITPEQYSFSTERKLSEILKGEENLNVEVFSFTRLCEDIFAKYNATDGKYIDDSGRHILMSVALQNVSDQLKLYKRYFSKIEFISSMVITVTELKYAGVSAKDFFDTALKCTQPFGDKLRELALIYSTYQSLLENGFSEKDDFKKAVELAQKNGYFCDCEIYIDSFTAFMAGERELIKCMLEDANNVAVCLCTDSSDPAASATDIFYSPKKTVSKLIAIAEDLSKPVEVEKLENVKRHSNNDVAFLSRNFLRNKEGKWEDTPENVVVFTAEDEIQEIEYIAAEIGNLTRNFGYRYKDIVLTTRTTGNYIEPIRTIFSRYNIPVFYDKRNEILKTPLVKSVMSFLSILSKRNQLDALFALLKSPYSPFDFSEVCKLENYCFVWSLDFADFKKSFTKDVGGFSGRANEKELDALNEIREKVMDALTSFSKETKSLNGKTFATQVYNFLKDFQIKEKFETEVSSLKKQGEISDANELTYVWNALIDCLKQIAISLENTCYDVAQMTDLFTVALAASDYATIPHHIDEVSVGDANRIRYDEPKIVFVFGANDGEFPKFSNENSLIDKRERMFLKDNDLEIDIDVMASFADERMYAYHAVSAPVDKLFVSHTNVDVKGQMHSPSLIVSEICSIFPNLTPKLIRDVDKRLFLHTPKSIRHSYAKEYFYGGKVKNAFESLNVDKEYQNRIKKATTLYNDFRIQNKTVSQKLFGKNLKLSASQVENFYKCSFGYFCQKGLRAEKLEKAQMSPIQSGNFIHYCLCRIIMDNGKEKLISLSNEEIFSQVESITQDYLNTELKIENADNARFQSLLFRLRNSVVRLVKRIQQEFTQTDFVPVKFEAKIGKNEEILPINIPLENGADIVVEGAVDRVDEYELDGVKYIRVIDYKSGTKNFSLEDISYGLNMQMLLYLFTLCDTEEKIPAGVLYMPSGDNYITANASDSGEKISQSRLKAQKMNGLVLDDTQIIEAMEHGAQGIYIPVDITKNKEISKKSSVASKNDFVAIRKQIEENLYKMGVALQNGEFSATPTSAKGYTPCRYCPYANICGVNQNAENSDINE